jgi:hypothetical protein
VVNGQGGFRIADEIPYTQDKAADHEGRAMTFDPIWSGYALQATRNLLRTAGGQAEFWTVAGTYLKLYERSFV